MTTYLFNILLLSFLFFSPTHSKKDRFKQLSDAELEALDNEWEDDDDIEPLDLPEWKRPKNELDYDDMLKEMQIQMEGGAAPKGNAGEKAKAAKTIEDLNKDMLIKRKKNQTLMMFVQVVQNKKPATRAFTEEISEIWEGMLYNAHLQSSRYISEDDQVLLKLDDGSKAFEIKDFLVEQENCYTVFIDNQEFKGKGYFKKDEL